MHTSNKYIPFWLAAFALLVLFTSCVTEKQRLRICKSCALSETRKDSIGKPEVTVTPFDTILWISRRGKPQHFTNCDSLIKALAAGNGTITTRENGIRGTITGTRKGFTFACEVDSLKEVIRLLRSKITQPVFTTITKEVPARCELHHLRKWDSFWIIMGRLQLGLVLLCLLLSLVWAKLRR